MFVNVWTTGGKLVTEELKQRSLTPKQVQYIHYHFSTILQIRAVSAFSVVILMTFFVIVLLIKDYIQ